MERKFDPMTGELLTQEPAAAEAAEQAAAATSEAVNEAASEVAESVQAAAETVTETVNTVAETPAFEMPAAPVQTGSFESAAPVQPVAKKKNKWVAPVVVAAIGIALIVAIVMLVSSMFGDPSKKVASAMKNTFKEESNLAKAFKTVEEIGKKDKYAVGMEFDIEGVAAEIEVAKVKDAYQIGGILEVAGVPDIDFQAELTSSDLKVQVPDFFDKTFLYNYADEKTGFITEFGSSQDFEIIDFFLEYIYTADQKSLNLDKAYNESFKEFYDGLKFKKVKKGNYEVDGKFRKCDGYKATITEKDLVALLDSMEEATLKEFADYEEFMSDMAGMQDGVFEAMFEELRDVFEDCPDIYLTFYIYKDQVACISMEIEDSYGALELLFKGSDKGMYNMELVFEDESLLELVGSVDGSEEVYELEVEGMTIASLVYDYKTSDFEIDLANAFRMDGTLESDGKTFTLTIDEMSIPGESMELGLVYTVTPDVTDYEFSKDVFDLSNASEEEYMELAEEIQSLMSY